MVSVAENTKVCLFGLNWDVLSISSKFSSSAKCPFSTMRSASSITRHLTRSFWTSCTSMHLNVIVSLFNKHHWFDQLNDQLESCNGIINKIVTE